MTSCPVERPRSPHGLLDFEALFAGLPTAYLVISPDLVIVEANKAYLKLARRTREDLVGRPVFDVFPPAPSDLGDKGRNPIEISFLRARDTGRPDVMPLHKYDLHDPDAGTHVERFWSVISAPLLDEDGSTRFVLQRVEDVTDFVRRRGEDEKAPQCAGSMQSVEAELFLRMEELRAAQHDRQVAADALQASEQRAHAVLDTAVDGIVMIDGSGRVESINTAAERMFGYTAAEVLGRNISMLMPEPYRSEHDSYLEHYQRTGERRIIGVGREVLGQRRDGSTVPLELAVSQVGADRALFTGVLRDITDRKQLEAQLRHQARHDPLTGLANRALLMERLEHALVRLARHRGLVALLFVDLDRFKLVNDTLGHDAGDELLIRTADKLRRTVRPEDLVARLGGDEFVILCEDLTSLADVEAVARRVVENLGSPQSLRGREVYVSASVGVVTDAGQRTASELLADADAAMYQAKEEGSGKYRLLDDAARARTSDRLLLSSELHRAIDRTQLRIDHQPLVDLSTGGVLAAEALLRWDHPLRGVLPPASFLSLADDVGLLADFDAWALGAACRDAAGWRRVSGRPVGVWVNLSSRTLARKELPYTVAHALELSRIEPALLTLEITEAALMLNAAATVRTLTTLRDLGVQLAVDDFGTGYSSLAYLQQFPVHALKVDRSFVARLDSAEPEAEASAAIVRAIVHLASALDLRTVAEGIETPAQLAAVTALGCDLGQGFFLGRPTVHDNIALAVTNGVVLPDAFAGTAVGLSPDRDRGYCGWSSA